MLDSELKSKINQLLDIFWSGGISNPVQAIEQISYLILMKHLEDEELVRERNAQASGEKYESLFIDYMDCRWSEWINYPIDKILNHVREKVFPFLRSLGDKDSFYARYMQDAVFSIPNASLLLDAIKIINMINFKELNRDTRGNIYEYLISELKTAGKNGQYITPRHIIRMMIELVDPQIGDVICDPACGTSGFLINSYQHILRDNTSEEFLKTDSEGIQYNLIGDKLSEKELDALKEESLYGYDFEQTMVRISLLNMIMHGINNPNIEHINTLSARYNGNENRYDLVLVNPPFKGSLDKSEISENFAIKTTKTEILFLELIYNILKKGGRCAAIVPRGMLLSRSEAHKNIRKKLLKDCRLDAVISMPSGVFKPYAGIPTGVLLFTKGEPTKKVWFYDMEADGFSLDDRRTYIDGKGDIPDILNKFDQRESKNIENRRSKHFFVPYKEIKNNDFSLSISTYKEIVKRKDMISILRKIAIKSGLKIYPMTDITTEINLHNTKSGFIEKPNVVYLPKIGNSPAVNLFTELKINPVNYFQIVLKKDTVNSSYLAHFFNTDLGLKWRKSLENGYIPKINKKSLLNSEVFLPDLKIQNNVLNAHSVIRDVLTELNIEKRKLWRNPQNAVKIQDKFENMRFTFEDWVNSLPFPLASILWSYDSELDGMIKFKYLLRFFEAFSQFNLTLILSAITIDKEFYAANFKKCVDKLDDNWFMKPDFGNWNSLGMCFSKKIRSIYERNDGSSETLNSLFGNPNNDFLKIITSKKLYKVLETARQYRNVWDAHDTPAIPIEECNKRTETLFNLALDLKELTSDLYNTILFFLPMKGGCKKGECYYEIRKLKGPNAYFKKDKIDISPFSGILDEDFIYFINEDQIEPIKLVELIKIMNSPQKEPNACYFYNRMDGNEARLITYHYKVKHEEHVKLELLDLF